jgi:FkbM family methyltransferase
MGLLRELYRRYLVARHLPRHWRLRPGTLDRRIVRHVLIDNEYRLPERFGPDDIILDVGGHIGSFALAALRRGAGVVYSFEPDEDNFRLLEHNLAPYAGRVRLRRAAVWRSGGPPAALALRNPLDGRNTGAGQVTEDGGSPIETIAFDDLLDEVTAGGRRVRLVKLDCEGAEWPILLTSRRLDRIDALCGEYHLGPLPELFRVAGRELSVEVLLGALAEAGFAARAEPLPPLPHPCGLFFARRDRAPAPEAPG